MRFPAAGESIFCKRLIISVVSDSAEVRIDVKQYQDDIFLWSLKDLIINVLYVWGSVKILTLKCVIF